MREIQLIFRHFMTVLLFFVGMFFAFDLIDSLESKAQSNRKPLKLISPIEKEKN